LVRQSPCRELRWVQIRAPNEFKRGFENEPNARRLMEPSLQTIDLDPAVITGSRSATSGANREGVWAKLQRFLYHRGAPSNPTAVSGGLKILRFSAAISSQLKKTFRVTNSVLFGRKATRQPFRSIFFYSDLLQTITRNLGLAGAGCGPLYGREVARRISSSTCRRHKMRRQGNLRRRTGFADWKVVPSEVEVGGFLRLSGK